MSIVIGLKYSKGVILAADKQCTIGNVKVGNTIKIYKSKYSETGMGVVGSVRDANLIYANIIDLMDYKDILDNVEIDLKYVINICINKIFDILKTNNTLEIINNIAEAESSFIVASDKRIFRVFHNAAVIEYADYTAIGCGEQLAKGYLDTINPDCTKLSKAQAIKIVTNAIEKACKDDAFINNDIHIIDLSKGESNGKSV